MKRRFRQKEDQAPKDDPKPEKASSKDNPVENVDIDNVVEEIDKHLKQKMNAGRKK